MKELCPKFGCPEFADQTMTSKEQDELLSDCVFDGCPVATVYAALSGYGHLRDRLRKHEDAMTNRGADAGRGGSILRRRRGCCTAVVRSERIITT